MKWSRGHQSDDVEVRGGSGRMGGGGLPIGLLSFIFSKFGFGGVAVAVLGFMALQYFASGPVTAPAATKSDERVQFVSFVLDDVQDAWAQKLPGYRRARMVVFNGSTNTGCGYGDRAIGPFYCPIDSKVYLDLDFFQTLSRRLGAAGDFAQAYVIAHEIGHHVQNLSRAGRPRNNAESVQLELQADCYAGVWAHTTAQRNLLEQGDLEEALTAARAIGDDTLQKQATGTVRPERWTHGSSAQRVAAFQRGFQSGDPASCR